MKLEPAAWPGGWPRESWCPQASEGVLDGGASVDLRHRGAGVGVARIVWLSRLWCPFPLFGRRWRISRSPPVTVSKDRSCGCLVRRLEKTTPSLWLQIPTPAKAETWAQRKGAVKMPVMRSTAANRESGYVSCPVVNIRDCKQRSRVASWTRVTMPPQSASVAGYLRTLRSQCPLSPAHEMNPALPDCSGT